ncbi:MAG TPA: fumarylacetoacetate hydrolase family protein [Candidatus Dormibacteraeota bacterium]|jgi:2-keto-4-pentenoate hydratase/2-oxohepta-3-ene-1,7-dioic acid hydratase in catechol pathway
MRLLMFREGAGRRLGVLGADGATVVDVAEVAAAAGEPAPADLLALIDEGDEGLRRVAALLQRQEAASGPAVRRLDGLELLPPLDPPRGNVLAIGRNYAKHAAEAASARGSAPAPPTIFTKAITTIAGPHADIPFDAGVSEQIDWEVELGVVIGRRGINIARERALDHVFGYTVINDVTARDIQSGWGGQFFKGKSLDGSCPSGPWVVTRDEIPDPQRLRLRLIVNGEVKQDASTEDMIYAVDAVVSWLSVGMTLLPGMLVATGTPEGVGFARKPPQFLRPGDVVDAEVEGIGALRNRVAAVQSPLAKV